MVISYLSRSRNSKYHEKLRKRELLREKQANLEEEEYP